MTHLFTHHLADHARIANMIYTMINKMISYAVLSPGSCQLYLAYQRCAQRVIIVVVVTGSAHPSCTQWIERTQ